MRTRKPKEHEATVAEIRAMILIRLGSRCTAPDCMWINADGSRGCTDKQCLQIDHKKGDGAADRKLSGKQKYLKMLNDPDFWEKYQLLCANCNWRKRARNAETGPRKALRKVRYVVGMGYQIQVVPDPSSVAGGVWVFYGRREDAPLSASQVFKAALGSKK